MMLYFKHTLQEDVNTDIYKIDYPEQEFPLIIIHFIHKKKEMLCVTDRSKISW